MGRPSEPTDSTHLWHRWGAERRDARVWGMDLSCTGSEPGVLSQIWGKDMALASSAPLQTSLSDGNRRPQQAQPQPWYLTHPSPPLHPCCPGLENSPLSPELTSRPLTATTCS